MAAQGQGGHDVGVDELSFQHLNDLTFSPEGTGPAPECLLFVLPQLAQLSAGVAADVFDGVPVLLHLERHREGLKGEQLRQHGVAGGPVQGAALRLDAGEEEGVGVLGKPAVRVAGDADDLAAVVLDSQHGGLQLGGLTGIGMVAMTTSPAASCPQEPWTALGAVEVVGGVAGGENREAA